MGLFKTWFIPLSRAFWMQTYSECPVTATIIGCYILRSCKCRRILEEASQPSIMGILQSIRTRSYELNLYLLSAASLIIISRAYFPSQTQSQISLTSLSFIEYLRMIISASILNPWSSTIRIFFLAFLIAKSSKKVLLLSLMKEPYSFSISLDTFSCSFLVIGRETFSGRINGSLLHAF